MPELPYYSPYGMGPSPANSPGAFGPVNQPQYTPPDPLGSIDEGWQPQNLQAYRAWMTWKNEHPDATDEEIAAAAQQILGGPSGLGQGVPNNNGSAGALPSPGTGGTGYGGVDPFQGVTMPWQQGGTGNETGGLGGGVQGPQRGGIGESPGAGGPGNGQAPGGYNPFMPGSGGYDGNDSGTMQPGIGGGLGGGMQGPVNGGIGTLPGAGGTGNGGFGGGGFGGGGAGGSESSRLPGVINPQPDDEDPRVDLGDPAPFPGGDNNAPLPPNPLPQPGTRPPYTPTNPTIEQPTAPPMPQTPGGLGAPIFPGGGGGGGTTLPQPPGPVDNSGAAQSLFQGFQDAQNAAQQANEQRYGQELQGQSGLINEQAARMNALMGQQGNRFNDATQQYTNLLTGYNGVTNNAAGQYGGIMGAYGQNAADQMARLAGLGQSAATNINTAAAQQQAQANQNLISRGLGNTTIAPNIARGIESDRMRQQTQLAEDLAREQNATQQNVTMPMLQAGAQFTGALSGLGTQGLQAGERFTGAQSDLAGQGIQLGQQVNQAEYGAGRDLIGLMDSRTDAYPSYETLANLAIGLGQAGSPIPAMPAPGNTQAPYLPTPNVSFFQGGQIPAPTPLVGQPQPAPPPPGTVIRGPLPPQAQAVVQGY